jgi:hypothetical protein
MTKKSVVNGLNILSESESDLPKTRKELVALIFKIAFLEAMALSLILPSVTSTGEITTPDAQHFEAQSLPCTILISQASCFVQFNFTKPFNIGETIEERCSWNSTSTYNIQGNTAMSSFLPILSTPTTWVGGMPVATTELFSNINNRAQRDQIWPSENSWVLYATVLTPSTSTTATLKLQYFQGGIWNDVSGASVNVHTTGLKSSGGGIPPPNTILQPFLIRVAGVNGGGVADTVQFDHIYVEMIFSLSAVLGSTQIIPIDNTSMFCVFNTALTVSVATGVVLDVEAWNCPGTHLGNTKQSC